MPEVNPASAPGVAAFDFDGTLTLRDTLGPFLIRSLGWPRFLWSIVLSAPWLAAYVLRLMSNHRAKARLLQVSLAGRSQAELECHAQDFAKHYLSDQWNAWGMQQLVEHQRQGHRCVIVSASPNVYLHTVGKSLGVDAVLCTEMEVINGRYTGRMATSNCHGEEKVRRLQIWLAERLSHDVQSILYAYGDTSGDKPMLRLAEHCWYRGKPWVNH